MSFVSTPEFDAFGPWIDEVSAPAGIPRLFRDYPVDLAATRLVLKVPRDISRRDATPDMDLYDNLLIVGEGELTILSRDGDVYTRSSMSFGEIAAFEDSVDLLDGRLVLHALHGPALSLAYNGASRQVVTRLTNLLRGLVPATTARVRLPIGRPTAGEVLPPLEMDDLGRQDVALVSATRELTDAEADVRLLSAHGRVALETNGRWLSRLLHAIRPMVLQGAVICASPAELHVIGRRGWLVRGSKPVNSLAHTTVALARITDVTSAPHRRYPAASVVTLHAGDTALELVVPAGSAAERTLLGTR
jgi:hypothetical protein